MIFTIPNLLSIDELEQIRQRLAQAELTDGKVTAGWHTKQVKYNQQLSGQHPTSQALVGQVRSIIQRNALFQTAVRPRAVHKLLVSHYGVGMGYGRHTDNALMGNPIMGGNCRSDVSFTLFLSEPEDYEGGELVIEGVDDERAYKLPARSMLVYPASTLHRVDPVERGDRWVVVGWAQSLIRDSHRRELLFELDTARRSLFAQHGKTDEFDLISKSVANLLRLWAE
ncbi:Fe2+-dependent dioxygenase [Romeria aff. gracilis LEGE 07310]|uniref:Fe2+-dependent dioxygenase n=1 Tax=Vasconcelosia minhoensis LEGE 07310 TaxID=915328 RepID=A0A8J7AZL3_9CYAN|nr:Fe2+-dependent dioxygenase [Romeria gracilis]MBE9079332.1 Fe2+-dependent dioxygenase [Romeria aff. gracilis LEGE 07310]